MRIKDIVGTRKIASTGRRLFDPSMEYAPTLRDGLLWTAPLIDKSHSIYDNGAVVYIDPESEEADADGTYFDSYGVMQDAILDVARIESDGYRQEETRTNLIPDSENLASSTSWSHSNVTYTANVTTAPDGTVTMDRLGSSAANSIIHQTHTIAADTELYAFTAYFPKVPSAPTNLPGLAFRFVVGGTQLWYSVSVNTETGVVTITDGDALPGSPDGIPALAYSELIETPFGDFWRVVMVAANASDTTVSIRVHPAIATAAAPSEYDAQILQGTVDAWGIQLEKADVPSSYIRTTGSTLTRTADFLRYTATGNISGSACTIAMAITPHLSGTANGTGRWFRWRATHWIDCYINAGKWAVNLKDAGASIDLISTTTLVAGRRDVLVLTHDGTALEQKMYVNGVKEGPTRTKGLMTSVSTLMSIGSTSPNSNVVPGNYAHLRIYDRALSAAEAQAVTDEINGWMD